MLMIDSPTIEECRQPESQTHKDDLNRLLCASVISKSFRNMLLTNPEIALATGYQGEKFNLSNEDRTWLFSIRPANLVDLAANMVAHQQTVSQECPVKVPLQPAHQYVRVN